MHRRRRTAPSRVLVIISTVVVALVLLLASGVGASGDAAGSTTEAYVVRSGDTLWGIAAARTPEGRDVRDVLAAIRSVNGLDGALIHPGHILEVPSTD